MLRKVIVGLLISLVIVTVWIVRMPLTLSIGSGPITYVTGTGNGWFTPIGSLTATATFSNSTAGNTLIAYVASTAGSTPHVVSMTAGWTRLGGVAQGAQSSVEIWAYSNNPGNLQKVDVVVSATSWTGYINVEEFSGIASTSPLDAMGTATATAGTSLVLTTTSAISAAKGLGIFWWVQRIAAPATVIYGTPAGWWENDSGGFSNIDHWQEGHLSDSVFNLGPSPTPGSSLTATVTSNTTTTSAAGIIIVLKAAPPVVDQTAYLAYD